MIKSNLKWICKFYLPAQWKLYLLLVFALSSQNIFCQYYQTLGQPFNISDGLSGNDVQDIIKDDIGFVWIATQNGLSRFDGNNFVNFNSKTHPTIFKDNEIQRIQRNGDFLYLYTKSDGLIKLQPNTLTFTKIFNSAPLSISFSGDTTAILFESGKLEIKVKNKNIYVSHFNVSTNDNLIIHHGQIYLSLKEMGILRFSILNPQQKILIPIKENIKAGKLIPSEKYNIIYHNGHTVKILKNDSLIFHPEINELTGVNFFKEDEHGKPMFITNQINVNVVINNTCLKILTRVDKNIELRSMCKVSENCFLLGTNQGVTRINKSPAFSEQIKDFSVSNFETIFVRRSIVENGNKLYLLNYPRIIEKDDGLRYLTDSICPVSDGLIFQNQLYYATDGDGLKSINLTSKKTTKHTCNVMRYNESFESISIFSDSLLLLTKDNKIVLYNPLSAIGRAYYLYKGAIIHVAIKDKKSNTIYLGTNSGISRIHLSKNKGIKLMDLFHKIDFDVRDILLRENEKQIWLATNQGVVILDMTNLKILKSYSNEQEVSNPKVCKLIEDNNNCIWATTYDGLTVYNTINKTIRFINNEHGLYNTEYNYKSACKLKNGKLIFGGLNSYELINPDELQKFEYATKFIISGIEISKSDSLTTFSNYIEGQKLNFNTGKESIKLYLANFDHLYKNGYVFEYSLDSKNWIKVNNKSCILISDLAYDDYILKIRMYNPFSQIVQEKQINISANIPFHFKTSFYLSLIFLIVIISVLFVRFIFLSKKKQMAIKTKIAMDLHDESGTILTRLLMISRKEKFEAKDKENIQNGLKEALFSFRTYIHSISKTKMSLHDFFDELNDFVNLICNQSKIEVVFKNYYDKNIEINSELYKDLKLSIYEIVTNCVKHSNADKISFLFIVKGKTLDITITDTGLVNITNLEGNHGNGIRNIKKRIYRNNGECSFSKTEGANGLTIKIKIPLS